MTSCVQVGIGGVGNILMDRSSLAQDKKNQGIESLFVKVVNVWNNVLKN